MWESKFILVVFIGFVGNCHNQVLLVKCTWLAIVIIHVWPPLWMQGFWYCVCSEPTAVCLYKARVDRQQHWLQRSNRCYHHFGNFQTNWRSHKKNVHMWKMFRVVASPLRSGCTEQIHPKVRPCNGQRTGKKSKPLHVRLSYQVNAQMFL